MLRTLLLLCLAASSLAQSVLVSFVFSGIPRVSQNASLIDDPKQSRLEDELSENGARQQFSLGLEYNKRYPSVFSNPRILTDKKIRLMAASDNVPMASSQALARGLVLNKAGPELSNPFPSTWNPPYRSLHRDLIRDSVLPDSMALLGSESFQMNGLLILYDLDRYCPRVTTTMAEKLQRYEQYTQVSLDQLATVLNIQEVRKRYLMLLNAHHYIEANLRNSGSIPFEFESISEQDRQLIRRGALLHYLGKIDDSALQIARLLTKDLYLIVDSFTKDLKGSLNQSQTRALIVHPEEENFIMMMNFLNITSRDCNEKIFSNKSNQINSTCESFPPYTSSINFEFYFGSTDNLAEEQWYVKANYNGESIPICSSPFHEECPILPFKKALKQSLWSANEEYYCDLNFLNNSDKKGQTYLLAWMFVAIFILLVAISAYFITKTSIKIDAIQMIYKNKQCYFHHPQGEFFQDAYQSPSANGSLL